MVDRRGVNITHRGISDSSWRGGGLTKHTHLAVSLQLALQPLKVAVSSFYTRVLQFEDGEVGLHTGREHRDGRGSGFVHRAPRANDQSVSLKGSDLGLNLIPRPQNVMFSNS